MAIAAPGMDAAAKPSLTSRSTAAKSTDRMAIGGSRSGWTEDSPGDEHENHQLKKDSQPTDPAWASGRRPAGGWLSGRRVRAAGQRRQPFFEAGAQPPGGGRSVEEPDAARSLIDVPPSFLLSSRVVRRLQPW